MHILTLNAGSSSIKYKVFSHHNQSNSLILSGLIEGIGEKSGNWHHQKTNKETRSHHYENHQQAFAALNEQLKQDLANYTIHGVGHRVVHGGDKFYLPTVITPEVLREIKGLSQLAPLHNPINALGIEYALQHFPEATQVAVFDNGFHHSMPTHVRHYAIDEKTARQYFIQRYGFHGINHEYVANEAAIFLQKPLDNCNFISLHLGNGASACLIKEGKSFDTTMGMTPLAGLVMGTRCGDIDPAIPLYLMKQGLSIDEVDSLLNKQSGLKGMANDNDMRNLLKRLAEHDSRAKLAIDTYVYAIQKIIGAYLTQISSLDALIFTGGIGENAAAIREKILSPLSHFGFIIDKALNDVRTDEKCHAISIKGTPVLVIRSDEEDFIAHKVAEKINQATAVGECTED
ncbi:MAG: acetate/propionate family kinase [Legionella sp.]|nr:acetate/propionate family kinase [Legionella sp.]